uniref:Uncharacterized protein n=2 Tax=Vibrio TaxID=662 RepID=A0A0H3ZR72_9VIBR|nr:hypothetical protein [Vibrio tasmaniensis]AKN39617.1 hypothetical protein [Vibrio crassostreae]
MWVFRRCCLESVISLLTSKNQCWCTYLIMMCPECKINLTPLVY